MSLVAEFWSGICRLPKYRMYVEPASRVTPIATGIYKETSLFYPALSLSITKGVDSQKRSPSDMYSTHCRHCLAGKVPNRPHRTDYQTNAQTGWLWHRSRETDHMRREGTSHKAVLLSMLRTPDWSRCVDKARLGLGCIDGPRMVT
jgi:hypothetical protein